MSKWVTLLSMTVLTGCLSLDGLVSTGASSAGAVLGTTLGGPTVGIVTGVGAGLAADAVVPPTETNTENFAGMDGELNFAEFLAFAWVNFTSHIMSVGIVVGILWLLFMYVGARMPRREEKQLQKMVNKMMDK